MQDRQALPDRSFLHYVSRTRTSRSAFTIYAWRASGLNGCRRNGKILIPVAIRIAFQSMVIFLVEIITDPCGTQA